MSMIRWDPGRDLMGLKQAIDKLFEEVPRPAHFSMELGGKDIPLDMYQTDKEIVIKALLPGLNPKDVDISISANTLTIKAEIKEDAETKDKDYIYKEHRYGSYSRLVTFPVPVDGEKADAVFENGALTVTVPKTEEAKPKPIKIRTMKEPKT
jgi:HSP20 family protein